MDFKTLQEAKRNAILRGEPIPESIKEFEKDHVFIDPYEFYTIGYGRTKIGSFIDRLRCHWIRTVIDTRDYPESQQNPPYSQTPLKKILKENNIDYVHARELGVPKAHRSSLSKQEDYDNLWKWYDSTRIPNLWSIVVRVKKTYAGKYAFMCAESNPLHCHRHRIAKAFTDKGSTCEDI